MNAVQWGAAAARGCSAGMAPGRARVSAQLEQMVGAPDQGFAAGYQALLASLERQFRDEECAVEAVNGRALHRHREQHARALAALHQLEPQVDSGDAATGRAGLELLQQWLVLHHAALDLALLCAFTPMGQRSPLRRNAYDPVIQPRQARAPTGGRFATT
jgi:hemerythrin